MFSKRPRALDDIPTYATTRPTLMISPLGFVHIPVVDPFKGITYKQIMEIIILCGISLGSSGAGVAASLREMYHDRVALSSAAEAS